MEFYKGTVLQSNLVYTYPTPPLGGTVSNTYTGLSTKTTYTCKLWNIDYYGATVGLPASVTFTTLRSGKLDEDPIKEDIKESIDDGSDFVIYPNPTRGELSIKFALEQASTVHIQLHDLTGRVLYNESTYREAGNQELWFKNIRYFAKSSGIILLKVVTDKATVVKKVIIE